MNVARRLALLFLLAVGFVFAFATRVRSQDATNRVKSSAETTRDETRKRYAKTQAKGVLKEVDLLRHQIRLATEDGPRIFPYTSRTYFFRDKAKIDADSLKVGEIIAVQFNTDKDGNVVVLRIKIRTPSELMEPPPISPIMATNFPSGNSP